MKKYISIILTIMCVTFAFMPSVYAHDNTVQYDNTDVNSYIEYFEDGSYTVTTITQSPTVRASSYIVEGKKLVHLYNSSDELQWTYTLIGTFNVTSGVSVVCTNSTYTCEIYDNHWSLTKHDNGYHDNIAYGTATLKKKVLFITTNTYDVNVEIGCDVNGNILV